jgi:glycosyltransferase involved in cell wall biosynthesis
MKILFASKRPPYPFFQGGAARSAHYLLSELVSTGHARCLAVGDARYAISGWRMPEAVDHAALGIIAVNQDGENPSLDCGYPVRLLGGLGEDLPKLIDDFDPDVVWTQLEGMEDVARIASRAGRSVVLYLRDAEDRPELLRSVAETGCCFVCNSEFMAARVRRLTGRGAGVIYPSLESSFGVRGDPDGFITMINPHHVKGVETFLAVARALPTQRFLLVESWILDPPALATLQQRLAGQPNVTFMRRVADIGEVYARTRLLLVPSLWEEAFGRVAIEAQSCGIPVLASRRGGLPESVGDGGLCVDDYVNPAAWVTAILGVVESEDRYRLLSARALTHAAGEPFTTAHAARRFLEICADRSLFGVPARKGVSSWFGRAAAFLERKS